MDRFSAWFDKTIGYTEQTYNANLWPSTPSATILLKKIEMCSPGLTLLKQGGKVVPGNLKKALIKKFSTDTCNRKDKLNLQTKKRGMNFVSL